MTIDKQSIIDFVWCAGTQCAGTHVPNDIKIKNFDLNIIDAIYIINNNYGVVNETNILIINALYTIKYKRIWPAWNESDSEIRLKGTVNVSFEGDEDLFIQHLTVLKLL